MNSRLLPSHAHIIGYLGVNHIVLSDFIQIQVKCCSFFGFNDNVEIIDVIDRHLSITL